jgi:hypothetical protein
MGSSSSPGIGHEHGPPSARRRPIEDGGRAPWRSRRRTLSSADLGLLRSPTAVVHAGLALLLLLAATALAVYKPRGRTRYGRRQHQERSTVGMP